MKRLRRYKVVDVIAITLLIVVALNALIAGYSFITDPSGSGLGLTTEYLKSSAPFRDFLVPGIVLFVANGIISIVVSMLIIFRLKGYEVFIIMQGCVLVGWIAIQLMMVTSFHPLQAVIGFIGLILVLIGWELIRDKKIQEISF